MNKSILIGAGAFVGGIAVGGTATYFIFRKRVIRNAEERATKEIESVKDTYKLLRKEPPYDDPQTAVKAYLERVDELGYMAENGIEAAEEAAEEAVVEAVEDLDEAIRELDEIEKSIESGDPDPEDIPEEDAQRSEEELHNIFERARRVYKGESGESSAEPERDTDTFDLLKTRDPQEPYIISTEDFMDSEMNFEKVTITYFEGDNTLSDDRESPIPDVEGTVGAANLNKFGVDSDSRDTVYIRNERLETDFEVVRDEGEYTEVVLGIKTNYNDKRVKRMRDNE